MENARVSIVNGEVAACQAQPRKLPFGTYIVVRYGVTNFRPNGKGERIARVYDDNLQTVLAAEWVLSSRRWRRGDPSEFARTDILRVATEEDIARFQPGVKTGKKRSVGW